MPAIVRHILVKDRELAAQLKQQLGLANFTEFTAFFTRWTSRVLLGEFGKIRAQAQLLLELRGKFAVFD